jgi:hypothetical protein
MSSRRCVCHGVCVCVCVYVCVPVCMCVCQCVFVYRGRHATTILGCQQLTVDFLQSLFLCMCVLCVTHCVCVSNWLCLCPCFRAIASGVCLGIFTSFKSHILVQDQIKRWCRPKGARVGGPGATQTFMMFRRPCLAA